MKPLTFFAILAALVGLGCASVHHATDGVIAYEAADEGLDSLAIEAKYFTK